MATIPMKEEDGVQEIYTREHGVVKVKENSWQDGGHHIVLAPNGAYQHMSGLPIKDEAEIEAAFGTNDADKQKCLNWFRNRHEQLDNPPRPIVFRSDNTPVFEDGSIPEESDLYNFFSPGPVLSAAIVGLYNYRHNADLSPDFRKPASAQAAQEAARYEDKSKAELDKIEAYKAKERIRQAKARAARAKEKTKAMTAAAAKKTAVKEAPAQA